MAKKYFDKYPPFINRVTEQEYIKNYLYSAPTSILFLYGPKSTGKTTLIEKVIQELPQKNYAINYLDMRRVLITDFSDFQNLFFPQDLKGKIKEIVSGIKVDFGFFGWDVDDEKAIKTNIFGVMFDKIKKANEKGIKPVIILDEFQYLKDIVIDEKNHLLLTEELFKFFIALTKVKHLAHIICLTSDSFYIEELYNHAKLKNTSTYFLVDHIDKKDVMHWLKEEEELDTEVAEYFWNHLGGSVWEIWQCLLDYKNTGNYQKTIDTFIQDEYVKSLEFWKNLSDATEKEIFLKVAKAIVEKGEYIIPRVENISELIKKTVALDIWFYDSRRQRITGNSRTTTLGFARFFDGE